MNKVRENQQSFTLLVLLNYGIGQNDPKGAVMIQNNPKQAVATHNEAEQPTITHSNQPKMTPSKLKKSQNDSR